MLFHEHRGSRRPGANLTRTSRLLSRRRLATAARVEPFDQRAWVAQRARRLSFVTYILNNLNIYILNFVARSVINILAEPIKDDPGLADWDIGLTSGLAFAVFHTLLELPIAQIAEQHLRRARRTICDDIVS